METTSEWPEFRCFLDLTFIERTLEFSVYRHARLRRQICRSDSSQYARGVSNKHYMNKEE